MMTIGLLMAGDPTGVLTKFSQTIKIISKLLYLNVPYGPRVKVFLENADRASKTLREPTFGEMEIKTNVNRGRLTTYKVIVNAERGQLVKIIIYLSSWILKLACSTIISRQINIPRFLLAFLYFAPKIHLVLYNTIVIDFCFYMSRTVLHSIDTFSKLLCLAVLLLVAIDILTIANLVWRDEPWLATYRIKDKRRKRHQLMNSLVKELHEKGEVTSIKKKKPSLQIGSSDKTISSIKNDDLSIKAGSSIQEMPDDSLKMIDYPRTYRRINYNMHLMNVMSSQLADRKDVF